MCFQVVLAYEVIVLCKCSGNVLIGSEYSAKITPKLKDEVRTNERDIYRLARRN